MTPQRRLGEWCNQTKLVRYRIFSKLFENHIFMDDGATPVEHGRAPAPASNPKFRDFSTKLLCLMSAFQHQNFHFFRTPEAFIKFVAIASRPHSALILTSGSLKIAILRARASKFAYLQNAEKNVFFLKFQNSSKIELRVAWKWYTHQNDGKDNTITMEKSLVGMRTSGTPEISEGAIRGKMVIFDMWSENGARRAPWRAIINICSRRAVDRLFAVILVGMPSSYDK